MNLRTRHKALGLALAAAAFSHAAHAADLGPRAYKAPAPAVSPIYNWSGFYIGVQGGGFYDRNHVTTPGGELISPISIHSGSYFAGGYAGYNYQVSSLVLGVEGDMSAVLGGRELSARQPTIAPGIFANSETDSKWLASVAGRAGFAMNNWLLYGKGGGAWMKTDYTANVLTAANVNLGTQTRSATRSGYLVGVGLEYAWSQNFVSKIEYNYIDFGTQRINYAFAGLNAADYNTKAHLVKAGLAYKFGGF
jgi:outer membrane immunogenic protein